MQAPAHLFPHLVHVDRPAISPDSDGSPVTTWVRVLSNVPCRVRAKDGGELDILGGPQNQDFATVYMDGALDVRDADRIIYQGRPWRVTHAHDFDNLNILKAIEVRRITDGPV